MPSYISHTKLAKDIYRELNNKVDYKYLITYSLGWDLSKYSKCRKYNHKIKQEEFFNNMINYIKENNLSNNKKIISILYGHISHYIMDETIHPLVKAISKNTIGKHKHTLIEEYYSYYLINNRNNYKKNLINTKIDKDIKNMLNYVYKKTYNVKNISIYYKINLTLYKLLGLFNIKLIRKITRLDKYLFNNKNIDLLNNNHLLYKYSLDELYNQSIDKTLKYIKNIDL